MSPPAPGCVASSGAALRQKGGADPESLPAECVQLVEEPPDASVSAREKDAAAA